MKKSVLYLFACGVFAFVACNNSNSNKQSTSVAEVLNTDTVNLTCDGEQGPVKLVFLGEQGDYERVTLFMDSSEVELLADSSAAGFRFTSKEKGMSLLSQNGQYTLYKDTSVLFSCFSGQTGREFKTATGVVFVVEETHPNGASTSNIRVTSRGLKEAEADWSYTDADPIKDAFLADLNNDGFEELYIITEVAGSGGYAGIIGVASNGDKSSSMITVPELTEEDMKAGKTFEGYQGHDKVYIENKQLVREFPIYKTGDNNATPTGGTRKVNYTLNKGETSWILAVAPAK